MCLGTDWVGQRLTTLFALWKAALGKKPVDRAKILYQQYVAGQAGQPDLPGSSSGSSGPGATSGAPDSNACRDELLSLLCALRSLRAFTLHSHETLLSSLPHLHKILVVFLTNISQLIVALPHPASASLRAKCGNVGLGAGAKSPTVMFAARCGIPEILLMIRTTMYMTFSAMVSTQYSSRFVPLLNMLADDVSRPLPAEFPLTEFVSHYLSPEDVVLDLVDSHMETAKDGAATIRLAVNNLLSLSPDCVPPQTGDRHRASGGDLLAEAGAAGDAAHRAR
jgi:hypothetical protein